MEMSSRQRDSIERAVAWPTMRVSRRGLLLMSLIQIWMVILVTPVTSESIEMLRKEDKDSVAFGFQSKNEHGSRKPRFIRFDPKAGNVDIDLEVKIPFLSIPLENKSNKTGLPALPLVKLNYKSLVFFGTLMALITFVIPVLFAELPKHQLSHLQDYHPNFKEHKRSDRGLDLTSYFGDSLNEILNVTNSKMTPCLERLVCTAVATAKRADEPTSFDVIVDALSSHSLFAEAVNGTVLKDAAAKGRQVLSAEDCAATSSECAFNQQILLNILKMIGL